MKITKELAIKYAKKLLPHFHLENYSATFKDADKLGFEKELLFVVNNTNSNYTREYDSHTIRFLFSETESIYQDLDTGLELDITCDLKSYLHNLKSIDIIKEKRHQKLGL